MGLFGHDDDRVELKTLALVLSQISKLRIDVLTLAREVRHMSTTTSAGFLALQAAEAVLVTEVASAAAAFKALQDQIAVLSQPNTEDVDVAAVAADMQVQLAALAAVFAPPAPAPVVEPTPAPIV